MGKIYTFKHQTLQNLQKKKPDLDEGQHVLCGVETQSHNDVTFWNKNVNFNGLNVYLKKLRKNEIKPAEPPRKVHSHANISRFNPGRLDLNFWPAHF